jgi:hypothetical protein
MPRHRSSSTKFLFAIFKIWHKDKKAGLWNEENLANPYIIEEQEEYCTPSSSVVHHSLPDGSQGCSVFLVRY